MQTKEEKTNKKQRVIILVLALITVVTLTFALIAISLDKEDAPLAPDYAPEVEENAEPIPDDDTGAASQKGDSVSLTYSDQVTIDLRKETASLMFANPGKSNKSIVLQIVIQDTVVAQSGNIMPGNQVVELDLRKDAANKLVSGGYYGKFAVFFYDLDSEEKAIVNTEIPITVIVR